MHYREFAPQPALAVAIDRLWVLEDDGGGAAIAPQPIMPDGRAELILHFGDAFERIAPGHVERQPRILFAGQLTSQLLLRQTGRAAVLGVRFRPHGAAALSRMPQHELAGLTVDVHAIAPRLQTELGRMLDSGLDLTGAAAAVQHLLQPFFRRDRLARRVHVAVEAIERSRGQVTVAALADYVGITRRHLERQFLDIVGVTPKRLARIARFQQALQALHAEGPPLSGADTAAACGYADQSHFVRDFRALAGCSPSEHLLRHGAMTGFFIG